MMQAWAVLECGEGNTELARQLFKCAVKADPSSEASWLVRALRPLYARSTCNLLRCAGGKGVHCFRAWCHVLASAGYWIQVLCLLSMCKRLMV